MNKIIQILIILALIGTASAAVYVTTNPEAMLFFSRDQPGPDVSPVTSLVLGNGTWSNSINIGPITGEYLTVQIMQTNTDTSVFSGVLKMDIECAEGLVSNSDGSIKDFSSIKYMHPNGTTYQCNEPANILRISSTKVTVTPTLYPYAFSSGVVVLSGVELGFIDNAYGHYKLTIYVDGDMI